MEVSEIQKRRAVNIIWNAARDYSFTPDFKAYDEDGNAELYWNCIIGAVRRHYDYPRLEKLFRSLQDYEDSDIYEGLMWLGLENCVFLRESPERPALAALREGYARRFVEALPPHEDYNLYNALARAHFARVSGEEVKISKYDINLLNALEFSPELDTGEIIERARELFKQWFQIRADERRREKRERFLNFGAKKRKYDGGKSRYRRFALGFADHPRNIYGGADTGGADAERAPLTKMTAAELREFMEVKYGKPMFDARRSADIEREVCVKNHAGCHLHFTHGESVPGKNKNGFEALQKNNELKQIAKNRAYYRERLSQGRTAINKLTGKIQNSVLLHLQPSPVRANSGNLSGGLVWRAQHLNDERVFIRSEQDNMGDLSVDILLDASTSQKYRQEIVSSQGYMIAESLTRCGIPCRVMSFCSMTGYTILRVFRDYTEPRDNEKIFEYVSNGCNRDGLAIRAAHKLMSSSPYDHKLLIILSDVKPNDVRKMRGSGEEEFIPYEAQAGINDTASEVRRARADGICVVCVFTGDDEDVPAAKQVYGRDFARIQSLDKLADTVGMLIQNQIKNL